MKYAPCTSTIALSLLGLIACGGSTPQGTSSAAGTGGSGTGGAGSGPSSSSAGGDGGASSSSSSSSSAGAPCSEHLQAAFDGQLDGRAVQASVATFGHGFTGPSFNVLVESGGLVELVTQDSFFDNGLKTNTTIPVTGFFGIPAPPMAPESWFCAGAGSSVTIGESSSETVLFTLDAITKLPACGDTPVAGTLTLCNSGDPAVCPQGQKFFTGTLDGSSINWTQAISQAGYDDALVYVYLTSRGFLSAHTQNGAVLNAVFMVPEGYPGAGTVYCAGSGSYQQNSGFEITLENLSLLGTCPAAMSAGGPVNGCSH